MKRMHQFKAAPKRWGSSLGITIPRDVVAQEHIHPNEPITVLILRQDQSKLKELFGSVKFGQTTKEIMDEIDEGWDTA